jgi:hypothetical protein
MNNNPNYTDLGLSSPMGIDLRKLVESQLLQDLRNYGIDKLDLKFDWSESCIEGHDTHYLKSNVENYSGISIYDKDERLVADGWMEFIHEGDFLITYWEFVQTFDNDKVIGKKDKPGIPKHIWDKLSDDIKPNYLMDRNE